MRPRDRHGALVIPPDTLPQLKAAIETVVANETLVISAARESNFDINELEHVWAKFEAART